jgi:putative lipase involved disintegration of autophagic bodies
MSDTVHRWDWAVDIRTHGIRVIVEKLLGEDWNEDAEVPPLIDEDEECVDCYNWEFGDFEKGGKHKLHNECAAL